MKTQHLDGEDAASENQRTQTLHVPTRTILKAGCEAWLGGCPYGFSTFILKAFRTPDLQKQRLKRQRPVIDETETAKLLNCAGPSFWSPKSKVEEQDGQKARQDM